MSAMVQLGSSAAGRPSSSSSSASSSSSSSSSSVAVAMLQQLSATSSLDNVHSTVPAAAVQHPGPSIGLTTLHLASQALEMMPDSSGADPDVDAPMPSDLPLKSPPTRITSPGYSPRGSQLYNCAAGRAMHSPPHASSSSSNRALLFNGNGSYFGLPYQDHNYGAPPPITPPATPSPSSQQQQQQQTSVKVNGHLSHIDIEHVSCHTTVSTTSSPPSSRDPQQHPPPPSPVAPPTPSALHTQQQQQQNSHSSDSDVTVDPGIDTGITRCICDFEHDDGYMICCDRCGVWQHVDCMGLDRNSIPESYFCELCEPRQLDKHRAVVIQTKKREFLKTLAVDSSATETEDETPHGKNKKKNKAGRKKRQERSMLALSKQPSELYSGNAALKMLKQRTKKRQLQQQAKMAAAAAVASSPPKKKFMVHSSPAKKVLGNRRSRQHSSPTYADVVMSPEGPLTPPPSSSNNQSWLDGSSSPEHMQADTYEEAKYNQYSIDVETLLTTGRFNGQHSSLKHDAMLQEQRCRVTQVTPSRKGLVATGDLECGEPLIEFKGKVMLREQYDKENLFFTTLHPFVLFYSKFDGFDLCIDASAYGSDARCVRRSCCPNAEVRHFIQGADIHFFIYSTEQLNCADEVTIPFDFHYQRCSYGVECACCKPACCPVVKSQQQHRKDSITDGKRKKKPRKINVRSESEKPPKRRWSESPLTTGRRRVSSKSRDEHLSSDNEDMSPVKGKTIKVATSPKSPKSPAPRAKRRRLSPLRVSHANNKPELRNGGRRDSVHEPKTDAPDSTPMSPEISSACSAMQSHSSSEADKKLTREEKKMEAIMKAFERMEKREERRKEAISRIHPKEEPSPTPARIKERKDSSKSSRDSRDAQPEVKVEARKAPRAGRRKGRARSECESDLKEESEEEEVIKEEVKDELLPEEEEEPKGRKVGKKGKQRKGSRPSSRRQSRANSTIAADSSDDGAHPPPHATSSSLPGTAASTPLPSSSSEPSTASSSVDKQFKFPKTKRLLMTEWLNEKHQLSVKTEEHSDDLTMTSEPVVQQPEEEASADFVRCNHSPHANSLSHLRRNSMSAAPAKPIAAAQVDSCFTKKRWLRQAMTEHKPCTSSSSSSSFAAREAEASPSDSPRAASPIDFVTPLKKRRLARESLGAASSTELLLSPVVSSDALSDSSRPATGQSSPRSSTTEPRNGLLAASSEEQSMVVECSSNNDSSLNSNTCRQIDLHGNADQHEAERIDLHGNADEVERPMSSHGLPSCVSQHFVDSSSCSAAGTCDSGGMELVQSSSSLLDEDDVCRRTTSDVCDSTALPLATSSSSVTGSPVARAAGEGEGGVSEGVGDTVSCSTDVMPCSEKEDGEISSDDDEPAAAAADLAADGGCVARHVASPAVVAVPSSSCEEISTSTDTPPCPPACSPLDFPITGGRLSSEDACVGSSSSDRVSADDQQQPSSSDHSQATVDSSQQQQQQKHGSQHSEAASSSCRKKVSLLEYRKRVKSVGSKDSPACTSSARRTSSPAPSAVAMVLPQGSTRPSLAPLPIFSGILGPPPSPPPPPPQPSQPADGKRGESETDVRWDASATSAERMREQTHLSLTERLRKEFGLDTSENEEEETNAEAASDDDDAGDDIPPPPPPPPPAAISPVAMAATPRAPPRPPAYPTPPQPPAFMSAAALLSTAAAPLMPDIPPPPRPPPMPPAPAMLSGLAAPPAEQMSNGAATSSSSSIPSLLSLPPLLPTRPFKRHVYEDASSSCNVPCSSSSSSSSSCCSSSRTPPLLLARGASIPNGDGLQAGEITSTAGEYNTFATPTSSSSSSSSFK